MGLEPLQKALRRFSETLFRRRSKSFLQGFYRAFKTILTRLRQASTGISRSFCSSRGFQNFQGSQGPKCLLSCLGSQHQQAESRGGWRAGLVAQWPLGRNQARHLWSGGYDVSLARGRSPTRSWPGVKLRSILVTVDTVFPQKKSTKIETMFI